MELSFPEDSKSSSEETDRSSYQNYDTVTGRSYECVFCKRGFTTAQALGGHMNIHRKDRAKTKPNFPPSSSSKVIDDNCRDLGFYSAIRSPPPGNYYSTSSEVNANYYQIFFPSLKPSYTYYSEVFCVQNPRDRGIFGEDWKRSLSLHGNPLSLCENEGKEADSGEEDGLDLELRLGYDP